MNFHLSGPSRPVSSARHRPGEDGLEQREQAVRADEDHEVPREGGDVRHVQRRHLLAFSRCTPSQAWRVAREQKKILPLAAATWLPFRWEAGRCEVRQGLDL